MAPKPRKEKRVASSSHGSKRSKRASKEEHDDIEKEEVDYRPVYDPERIDVTKTKEPEGSYPGFEELLDDEVATTDEMARVDSDIESSDAEEEDSEKGEAAFSSTDDND
ncbi:hypothetical protein HAX54_040804 [Datura stramonium]|uniref:Uncharacterized protein n=1 Tax=Datura stramonium TaxID=4076 RepID=A0ABS8VNR2_DATST|nr:hypothetical protein [Datura stramonium]